MRLLRVSFCLLTAIIALSGVTHGEQRTSYDPAAAFKETDKNGDGAIDLEEFHQRIVEVFYFTDSDKDGFLSVEEFSRLPYPEGFKDADRNGDGRISLHEFVRIRFVQFEEADTNDDGEVSLDEVVTAFEGKKSQ